MTSIGIARIGCYLLRFGPQSGTPLFLCSRQTHNASVTSYDRSLHQTSRANQPKPKRSKTVTAHNSDLEIAESFRHFRRFITDPGLISSTVKCLTPWDSRGKAPIIMECNPGPGFLTRALLDAGHKVIALESDSEFLPSLESIERAASGQLKVVHCDFFRIDPWSEGLVKPPAMYSSALMKKLNFSEVSWASDVPLKLILMFGHKKERTLLWRHIYYVYERLSVYRFGRMELNVFLTEKQYRKLISKPGDFQNYQALSVLYQVACDIEMLHKEPMSTFMTPSRFRSSGYPDDDLCLVRITPRRNLFSEYLTPAEGKMFIHMIKQFLTSRRSKLIDKLDNLAPGNGKNLLKSLALPKDVTTGCIFPEEYRLLFEILSRSEEFNQSFVFDEICEEIAVRSY